jgi:excisionase family DNA binding protein
VFLVFGGHPVRVAGSSTGDLLTTGAVAVALGVSRQHVVDLCSRGELPYVMVGTHRRVRRRDVDLFLGEGMTREAERSLWLHRAVAGRLVLNPDGVMVLARDNLARLLATHPSGMSAVWLARWRGVVEDGVDAVLHVLTSGSGRAVELRQNSPFAGVLTEDERAAVLAAFGRHWRSAHTAA